MNLLKSYAQEMLTGRNESINAAIVSVQNGLEYARECLNYHDGTVGRTTPKNRIWAETIESDIRQMEAALKMLKECNGDSK